MTHLRFHTHQSQRGVNVSVPRSGVADGIVMPNNMPWAARMDRGME
eukprot:CAMPEP_0116842932 /NCGR_PEP_ID=MMETSP0418-20121206/11798_1 /TAXON_ID=1158023 /ORGANISM="Astrosyne radiata, Strain 13vi08-1A" /LENGTH=45 /DNA_ID= /DNA_START= /DNA_END= /DNA_ORIENTATION=